MAWKRKKDIFRLARKARVSERVTAASHPDIFRCDTLRGLVASGLQ